MIPATRSNGIDVPFVFNEMGVMADPLVYSNDYFSSSQQPESKLSISQRMENELLFGMQYLKMPKTWVLEFALSTGCRQVFGLAGNL